MKPIKEKFSNMRSIAEVAEYESVNEGLKDILQMVKDKFKQAWQYLKGVVAKFGTYFLPVDADGNVLPAISPLTMGSAYKDGYINKNSTCVVLDKEGQRITGCRTDYKDCIKLYGHGNSISWWEEILESCEGKQANINEVKMHTEDPEAMYNIVADDKMLATQIKMVIKNKNLARLLIFGAPGIGKTAILMSVVDELRKDFPNYKLICKTLSQETPDNFVLPKYTIEDGQEKATDVPKTWLPVYKPTGDPSKDAELDAACGDGLLFIDELSRATPQVLNVVLPLINEGMFNGYKLGSGWSIICASNRAEDEMSGQAEIGNALSNRFAVVYYEPTCKSWRNWADKQKFISPLITQWLSMPESENMSGGKFFYMDPNEDMDDGRVTKLMCTPRAWTNAMRELALYSHTGSLEGFTIFDIPENIITFTLNKYVPASAISALMAFLHVIRSIGNFDDAVYDVWQNGGGRFKIDKKDLSKVALPLAQLICSAHAEDLPTAEEFKNLSKWLVSLNSDQMASYVLDVYKNVFCASVDEDLRDGCFVLAKKLNTLPKDDPKYKLYANTYAPFMKKWGLTVDTVPDWSIGLNDLGKKYAGSFSAAKIEGRDALG